MAKRIRTGWWLDFSDDAMEDLKDRVVTVRDVKNALRNQTGERPGKSKLKPTIVIVGTAMNGRSLCVAVDEEDRDRIVSLWWEDDPVAL